MARTLVVVAHVMAAHMLGFPPGPPRMPASSHAPRILASLSAPSEQTQEQPSERQAHSAKMMVAVDARYWVRCVSGASTSASTAAASVAAPCAPQLKKGESGRMGVGC